VGALLRVFPRAPRLHVGKATQRQHRDQRRQAENQNTGPDRHTRAPRSSRSLRRRHDARALAWQASPLIAEVSTGVVTLVQIAAQALLAFQDHGAAAPVLNYSS